MNALDKRIARRLLSEWACNAWDVVLRTIWLGLAALAFYGLMALMSWADAGSRGECPVNELSPN